MCSHVERLLRAAVLLLVTALGACGDGGADSAFAGHLNVDLGAMERSESGLYRRDLVDGSGAMASRGDVVTVHYTGWLPDGSEFESSRGRAPFNFVLGSGQVMQGWEEGVNGMRVGGRRQLVIPSELAYGPGGIPGVIPPGATLVFDVELLGVD